MRLRAVLLILIASIVLLAVAVGGLFLLLNPERIRSTAEASLGRALGQEVRLEGPIARRFLPTPEVVIMSPKVLARSDGRILAQADRIDLQLAPAGLVSGQEPVGSMTVVRPALIAPLTSNDLLSLARGSGVGLISVTDGEVELRLAPGALPLRLSSMNLERSQDQDGLARVEVAAIAEGQPLHLRARLRAPDGGGGVPGQIDLDIGEVNARVALRWQGLVAEGRLFGQVSVDAAQALPAWLGKIAALAPPPPWSASARIEVSPAEAKVSDLLGKVAGAGVSGSLELDRTTKKGSARLELRDAVFDRPPAAMATVLQELPKGYDLALQLLARSLSVRGVAVPSLDARGELGQDSTVAIERAVASIGADGTARLEDGRLRPGPQPILEGRVSLDLPTAKPILGQLGVLPEWLLADKPGTVFADGELRWSADGIGLSDADLRSDQAGFHGDLGWSNRRLAVSGEVDRLDLSEWFGQDLDLKKALARLPDGTAKLRIGRVSRGDDWIENVAIEAERDRGRLTMTEASAGSPDDLHLTLAGSIERNAAALDLVIGVDAPKPARLATLLDLPLLARLKGLEGTLSLRGPVDRLDMTLDASSAERRATVAGTLGLGGNVRATDLRVEVDAPDLPSLLSDLALLPIVPGALAGPVAAKADLARGDDGKWLAKLDVRAGPLKGDAQLDLKTGGEVPRLAGQIALAPIEPAALQAAYDFASTTLAFAPGSPLRWPGNWPAADLRWNWLFGTDLDLALRRRGATERSGLGRIRLADGKLDLERLDLDLPGGGRLSGDATVDGRGEVPTIGMSLSLDKVDFAHAVGWFGIARAPRAALAAELDLAGQGGSVASMVGDLKGTVRLAMGAGTIPPPVGSDAAPFAFSGVSGELDATRGILRSQPPHLALDMPDGTRRYLATTLDLPVWFFEMTLLPDAGQPGLRVLGPPIQLQTVEFSPTDPASIPAAPAGRIRPPSAAQAPAPPP